MKIAILILVSILSFSTPLFAQTSNDDRCYDCYFDGKDINCVERPCDDGRKDSSTAERQSPSAEDHSRDSVSSNESAHRQERSAKEVPSTVKVGTENITAKEQTIIPAEVLQQLQRTEEYYDECNATEDDADSATVCVLSKTIGRLFPRTPAEFKAEFKAYGRLSLSEFKAKYGKEHIAPDVDFRLTKLAFFKTKLLLRRLPDLIYINSAYRSKDHPKERKKKKPGTGPHCTMRAVDFRPGGHTNRAKADWRAPMLNFLNYNQEKTQIIVNAILKIDPKAVILFNDPAIKGVKYYSGHDDHIHVTWSKDGVSGYSVKDE